jgi:hypothetical protein
MTFRFLVSCALALSACSQPYVAAPVSSGKTIAQIIAKPGETPRSSKGACWGKDVTPAIIETVTEQILLSEEQRDVAGNVIRPASYRSNIHQRMVQDTREVWFRTPCAENLTVSFIATLQRALKARGLYTATVTGEMSDETGEAIRRFQAERGLDSPVLSLVAAQELGLLATDLERQ